MCVSCIIWLKLNIKVLWTSKTFTTSILPIILKIMGTSMTLKTFSKSLIASMKWRTIIWISLIIRRISWIIIVSWIIRRISWIISVIIISWIIRRISWIIIVSWIIRRIFWIISVIIVSWIIRRISWIISVKTTTIIKIVSSIEITAIIMSISSIMLISLIIVRLGSISIIWMWLIAMTLEIATKILLIVHVYC